MTNLIKILTFYEAYGIIMSVILHKRRIGV